MDIKNMKYVGWSIAWERNGVKLAVIVNAKSKKTAITKLETFLDKPTAHAFCQRVCVVVWPGPEGVKELKPISLRTAFFSPVKETD